MKKTEDKIFSAEELVSILQKNRDQHQKVVFTNGCFDLIHTGHTRYLRAARNVGDALIVAVNSDRSVAELKTPKRPIVPLEERMEILAGFYFIDYVVSFDESTPYNLINLLKPDVLVKGGDWDISQIVGKDIVEENGGLVLTIPVIPGVSTTGLVERVLERYK